MVERFIENYMIPGADKFIYVDVDEKEPDHWDYMSGEAFGNMREAIKNKPDWKLKIQNPNIRNKYKKELIIQLKKHANYSNLYLYDKMVDALFVELLNEINEENKIYEEIEFGNYGICYNDELIPEVMRYYLEEYLDRIANSDNKDYHPGTDKKILNLFHPSMYPVISGITCDYNGNIIKKDKFEHITEFDKYNKSKEKLNYQWLPADFYVDNDYKVTIKSYINNLPGELDDPLHKLIYNILSLSLKQLDITLEHKNIESDTKEHFKNKDIQVVVKACNYILKPGQSYEGGWHIEGCTYEHIIASAIYYYSIDGEMDGEGLSFRKLRDTDVDYPSNELRFEDIDSAISQQNWTMNIPLGTVPTPQNRLLTFPNTLQHKVAKLTNNSENTINRKILCFFIVDPAHKITSSSDVPKQQWDVIKEKINNAQKDYIIKDLANMVNEYIKTGITHEEALDHRLKLMKERKFTVDKDNKEFEREYTLCEH
jgi:hypothetical protein